MPARLLITGAGGFLGESLCRTAQASWRVFGAVFSRSPEISDVELFKADLAVERDLDRLFTEVRPDAVIHAAALSNPNYCEIHPDESFAVNVKSAEMLAMRCADLRIPFLFTSTDLAFDGKKGFYAESDPPSPVSVYGRHKVEAEKTVLKSYPAATVCRIPMMFGWSSMKPSFLQTMVENLKNGVSFSLFTDEFRTPLSYPHTARVLIALLERPFQGLLHIAGAGRISRYEFGLLTAKITGGDDGCINPCLQREISMPAPRPRDVSLNGSRAWNWLGFRPPSLKQQLSEILL